MSTGKGAERAWRMRSSIVMGLLVSVECFSLGELGDGEAAVGVVG